MRVGGRQHTYGVVAREGGCCTAVVEVYVWCASGGGGPLARSSSADLAEIVDKRVRRGASKDSTTPEQFEYYVHYVDCMLLCGRGACARPCAWVVAVGVRSSLFCLVVVCCLLSVPDNRRLDEWVSVDRIGPAATPAAGAGSGAVAAGGLPDAEVGVPSHVHPAYFCIHSVDVVLVTMAGFRSSCNPARKA